jgi:hypothetical protein
VDKAKSRIEENLYIGRVYNKEGPAIRVDTVGRLVIIALGGNLGKPVFL